MQPWKSDLAFPWHYATFLHFITFTGVFKSLLILKIPFLLLPLPMKLLFNELQ